MIYAQYINTAITFENVLPSEQNFMQRMAEIIGQYPFLVWEESERVVGYAYAHRQMERAAYQWKDVYKRQVVCFVKFLLNLWQVFC